MIAEISIKYSAISPGLSSRICNTYIEAISQSKSLVVAYGGIIGLGALGISAVESVLLERIALIGNILDESVRKLGSNKSSQDVYQEHHLAIMKCKEALLLGLGQFIL